MFFFSVNLSRVWRETAPILKLLARTIHSLTVKVYLEK